MLRALDHDRDHLLHCWVKRKVHGYTSFEISTPHAFLKLFKENQMDIDLGTAALNWTQTKVQEGEKDPVVMVTGTLMIKQKERKVPLKKQVAMVTSIFKGKYRYIKKNIFPEATMGRENPIHVRVLNHRETCENHWNGRLQKWHA